MFDFLRREPETYRAELSLFRFERRSRLLPPRAVNLRSGRTVWERLGDAGLSSTVLRCPATFPPAKFKGRILAGVGVPDLRGGISTAVLLGTSPTEGREGEEVVLLRREHEGWRAVLTIPGLHGRASAEVELEVANGDARLAIGATVTQVRQGVWTDWLPVAFAAGLSGTLRGLVRALPLRLGDSPAVYLSAVNYDPGQPLFPISHPWGYAGDLARAIGSYGTLGMLEDHRGLSNGRFDEGAFLEHCRLAFVEREAMLFQALSDPAASLVFCVFDTPDRVQHMFWRYTVDGHPANRETPVRPEFQGAIAAHYAECDALIGRVVESLGEGTLLLVVSDHGFTGFHRAVELNRWLAQEGYLGLRAGVDPDDPETDTLRGIDWERTRAYSLGFGGVYLNQVGREGLGMVPAAERDGLLDEIVGRLSGLQDPATGHTAILGVDRRERAYAGPRVPEAPDLVVKFNRGYRAGWRSAAGGVGRGSVFVDNRRVWGGDHIVAPELVPGILLANRPLDLRSPTLLDCAPTILDALLGARGALVGDGLEGRSLLR